MSEIKALEKLRDELTKRGESDEMMGLFLHDHEVAMQLIASVYREVDERFMELPLDADGVPIRVGDMIEYEGDEDTYRLHARGVYVYDDGRVAVMNERLGIWYPENCRHVKPRTLEDVLREFAHKGIRIWSKNGIKCGEFDFYANEYEIAEYAAEIRELLEPTKHYDIQILDEYEIMCGGEGK